MTQCGPGSRAGHGALEALTFLTAKYAFSHFSLYFSFPVGGGGVPPVLMGEEGVPPDRTRTGLLPSHCTT